MILIIIGLRQINNKSFCPSSSRRMTHNLHPRIFQILCDTRVMREFAGIDLGEEAASDESAILEFRHPLEPKGMGAELLRRAHEYLAEDGLKVYAV